MKHARRIAVGVALPQLTALTAEVQVFKVQMYNYMVLKAYYGVQIFFQYVIVKGTYTNLSARLLGIFEFGRRDSCVKANLPKQDFFIVPDIIFNRTF